MKTHLMWMVHNLIAHPVSEIVHLFGLITPGNYLERLSNWIHDVTVPEHEEGTGRG